MSWRKEFSHYLEAYFSLRRFERYGLFVILLIGVIGFFVSIKVKPDHEFSEVEIKEFLMAIQAMEEQHKTSGFPLETQQLALSAFNPNTVTLEQLEKMGLSSKAARSIVNFRNSGFRYKRKEDLMQCYGIDDSLYMQLLPFIRIASKQKSAKKYDQNRESKEQLRIKPTPFDPNTVKESALKKMNLPEKFISGFLNYRNTGVKFYNWQDMDRLYVLTPAIKLALSSYLLFPDRPPSIKTNNDGSNPGPIRFRFDPNKVSKDSLILLGVYRKAAANWVAFRSKGKVYRDISDLKMIYGLTEEMITPLIDWIDFPGVVAIQPALPISRSIPSLGIDLNTTSKEELQTINGIGAYYANGIIWYGDALGGYYSIDQLQEINQLPDSVFQAIKFHFVQPDITLINSINVQTASRAELADHPYLNHEIAKRWVTYREMVGHIENLEKLVALEIINRHQAARLAPYLSF